MIEHRYPKIKRIVLFWAQFAKYGVFWLCGGVALSAAKDKASERGRALRMQRGAVARGELRLAPLCPA